MNYMPCHCAARFLVFPVLGSDPKVSFFLTKGSQIAPIIGIRLLLKALEKSCTPETCSAGHAVNVTVLFKILLLDIVAKRKAAVITEGKLVTEDVLPEGTEVLAVPDLQDISLMQIAEYPRLDVFLPATYIAVIAMPQEIAGMDVTLP